MVNSEELIGDTQRLTLQYPDGVKPGFDSIFSKYTINCH